jgi:hypothetical protein
MSCGGDGDGDCDGHDGDDDDDTETVMVLHCNEYNVITCRLSESKSSNFRPTSCPSRLSVAYNKEDL